MLLSTNIFLLLLVLFSYSIYLFSSTFKDQRVHYYDVRLIFAGERENHLVNPPINDQIQFLITQDDTTLKIFRNGAELHEHGNFVACPVYSLLHIDLILDFMTFLSLFFREILTDNLDYK